MGGQRFYDSRSKQSFKYDHLRKEAQDYEPYEPDPVAEPWRSVLQDEITTYTQNHYRHGACAVFGRSQGGTYILIFTFLWENYVEHRDNRGQRIIFMFLQVI